MYQVDNSTSKVAFSLKYFRYALGKNRLIDTFFANNVELCLTKQGICAY